ncbi:hypothetical protein [Thioclava sp.]|uniref:hypothetical protein n=1 Tax=Thioclava sp. TaxID=1933450 RepID=UPI003AA9C164
MKLTLISTFALAMSITVPNIVVAQDQTQDRNQLKGCDGVSSNACAMLLRERDLLQECADQDRDRDQSKDQDRGCAPNSAGSGGSGKN